MVIFDNVLGDLRLRSTRLKTVQSLVNFILKTVNPSYIHKDHIANILLWKIVSQEQTP